MNNIRLAAIAAMVCVGGSFPSFAADNNLTPTSVRIFDLVKDARSSAMGGAYTAVSDDSGCLYYNPAGLALIDNIEVPAQQNVLFGKVNQYSAGFVYSLHDLRTDNLANTGTIAVFYDTYDQSSLPRGDENGNFLSDPKATGELMSGSYGTTVFDGETAGKFMIGATLKLYKEQVLGTDYNWQSYDAGLLWNEAHCPLSVGASVGNISKDTNNPNIKTEVPQTGRLGLGYGFFNKRLTLSTDFIKAINDDARYACGAEYNVVGPILLRAGYRSNSANVNNFTGGAGICLKNVDLFFLYAREICVDYAYTSFITAGDVQYVSINIKLGAD